MRWLAMSLRCSCSAYTTLWLIAGAATAQPVGFPNRHEPLPGITTAGLPSAAALEIRCAGRFRDRHRLAGCSPKTVTSMSARPSNG
jgi:hypothetical protein